MTKEDLAKTALGRRLREAREYRGFSQDEVAQNLGIPRSAISLIENGSRNVEATELHRLAKLYECTVGHLLGEGKDDSPESIQLIARASARLSTEDQEELLRFADFLKSRNSRAKKP